MASKGCIGGGVDDGCSIGCGVGSGGVNGGHGSGGFGGGRCGSGCRCGAGGGRKPPSLIQITRTKIARDTSQTKNTSFVVIGL